MPDRAPVETIPFARLGWAGWLGCHGENQQEFDSTFLLWCVFITGNLKWNFEVS